MRCLLDTNAVISLLRGASDVLDRRVRREAPADVGISSIVAHELYFGAYRSRRVAENVAVVDDLRFEILAFDTEDAREAGEIRAALSADGSTIGPYDVLIAGQARARGLVLVTNNLREFRRVRGLSCEDWTAEAG